MKGALFAFASLLSCLVAAGSLALGDAREAADRLAFQGPWQTTNRKLDGVMSCVVTKRAEQKWQGRFSGIWNGVSFDHTVAFTGPPEALRGTATIDGAHYDWTGEITSSTPRRFKGSFGGDRYTGFFDLSEQPSGASYAR